MKLLLSTVNGYHENERNGLENIKPKGIYQYETIFLESIFQFIFLFLWYLEKSNWNKKPTTNNKNQEDFLPTESSRYSPSRQGGQAKWTWNSSIQSRNKDKRLVPGDRIHFSSLSVTGSPVQERLTCHPLSKWSNLHKLAKFRQTYTACLDVISSQVIQDSVKLMTLRIYIMYQFTKFVRYKDKMQDYTPYLHTRNDQGPNVKLFEK